MNRSDQVSLTIKPAFHVYVFISLLFLPITFLFLSDFIRNQSLPALFFCISLLFILTLIMFKLSKLVICFDGHHIMAGGVTVKIKNLINVKIEQGGHDKAAGFVRLVITQRGGSAININMKLYKVSDIKLLIGIFEELNIFDEKEIPFLAKKYVQ